MRLIDTDAVLASVDPLALVEALRAGHLVEPPPEAERLLIAERDRPNECLIWGGWRRREGLAVKATSIFPENVRGSLPNLQSVVVLFDGRDGRPLAALHGTAFTRMKTAADSALAADLLARKDVETLAVFGAGGQAETHVRFMLAVRPSIRRVIVCNRTPARAEALARTIRRAFGVEVSASSDIERAVREAGVVSCLTASPSPILAGRWLEPGAHVDLVGGYTPDMREADDATLLRGRLFADTRRFTLETCGDFSQPIAAGVIGPERIEGDLFELAAGACAARRTEAEITVFKNGGGGHLDLMVARSLYDLTEASINDREATPARRN